MNLVNDTVGVEKEVEAEPTPVVDKTADYSRLSPAMADIMRKHDADVSSAEDKE